MDIKSLQCGFAVFSLTNPTPITWIVSRVVRSQDGDIVIDIVKADWARYQCTISNGAKVRMYLSEALETLTNNFFESAQFNN